MSAVGLIAVAMIALTFVGCVLAVVISAAEAGRITARRLQARAEAHLAEQETVPASSATQLRREPHEKSRRSSGIPRRRGGRPLS